MAILVNDLSSKYNLFFDSESYLDAVDEDELRITVGGVTPGAYVLTGFIIFGSGAGFGALAYNLLK